MKKLIYLFVMAVLVSGCVTKHRGLTVNEKAIAEGLQGKTYYTQANIWHVYERERISSDNFHGGEILPLGTKVRIIKCGDAEVKFTDESGKIYILVLARGSLIDLMTLFNRYFSEENIKSEGGRFSKLSEQEQENIRKAIIDYGMSKEATIMAYGYPTPLKGFTPDIKSNQWQYFLENHLKRAAVYLLNDKIIKIEDIRFGRKKPGRRRKQTVIREDKTFVREEDSKVDEIQQYKKLLDSGAITKEEYEQKKKQLLGL